MSEPSLRRNFQRVRDRMLAQNVSNQILVETIAEALERATGGSFSSAKDVALRIGRSVATVRNWFRRANGPGAAELIELMREFDEVHTAVLELAGRAPEAVTEEQRRKIAAAMAILQGDRAA